MLDRRVQQVVPPTEEEEPVYFSQFSHTRNIVLLGDPGSGKTHLFKALAENESALFLSARTFLTRRLESMQGFDCVFIDALDEKRTGRGDADTLDSIVTKLELLRPKKIRISCRAADWLGETDLAAFSDYFERNGGATVVALANLSDDEQANVLRAAGRAEPEIFLEQARERGLGPLLVNPQSLLMLNDVVRDSAWPSSRSELFSATLNLLATETNRGHSQRSATGHSTQEVIECAGALCALRLIGDLAGIAISPIDSSEDCPPLVEIQLCSTQVSDVAVERRIFSVHNGVADYSHRTIAEYTAAKWISTQVRRGLPLGRLLSLLCVRGEPTSELRGLFAWLPIFLPESAKVLITADPFGILTYGDPTSLPAHQRRHLLEELAKLSEKDPWFRNSNWSRTSVSGLSSPDMLGAFREYLQPGRAESAVRSIILDSLITGTALPELLPDLERLLVASECSFVEREAAAEALARLGAAGLDSVRDAISRIGVTTDQLHLRARVLCLLPEDAETGDRVSRLLLDALAPNTADLPGGAFWQLGDDISPEAAAKTLHSLLREGVPENKATDFGSCYEVIRFVDGLIEKVLNNTRIDSDTLAPWLHLRWDIARSRDQFRSERLASALSANPEVVTGLVDRFLMNLDEYPCWESERSFYQSTLGVAPSQLMLDRAMALLHESSPVSAPLYAFAIDTCINRTNDLAAFELLLQLAEANPVLGNFRDRSCYQIIPDWRWSSFDNRDSRSQKAAEALKKRQSDFRRNKERIAKGSHAGWIDWLGNAYMSVFSDVPGDTPYARLESLLGGKHADVAVEGLKQYALHAPVETVDTVVDQQKNGTILRRWMPLLAGFNELVRSPADLDRFDVQTVASMLRIECHVSLLERSGNSIGPVDPTWKEIVVRDQPAFVCSVYEELVLAELESGCTRSAAIYKLLGTRFPGELRAAAAERILCRFPSIQREYLLILIKAVLEEGMPEKLLEISRNRVGSELETATTWMAIAFSLNADFLHAQLSQLNPESAKAFFWEVREVGGGRRLSESQVAVSVDRIEFLIAIGIGVFPFERHPTGGWSGDQNPWDATDQVCSLISKLASNSSAAATDAFDRILGNPGIGGYREFALHSAAQQLARRRDSEFVQPHWRSVARTLSGGEPANCADLNALVLAVLADLKVYIANSNTDVFRQFWNEDSRGNLESAKAEESGRDSIVQLLRSRISQLDLSVEPEAHMPNDKRADIAIFNSRLKLVVEVKRDFNEDLWNAPREQLQRLYARDPHTNGFGIYLVFWYGKKRRRLIPLDAKGIRPDSPFELETALNSNLANDLMPRLTAVVLDVSGEIPP